jgi:putative OPT family oligopeptide transporter
MATPAPAPSPTNTAAEPEFEPFVPASAEMPEFTWSAVILGAVLGIIFGASSLYLVLKVGMTVSASIPVAVLAITLFRLFSRVTGMRRATILENNIVQTTGSAGESIAFGVGVTIPALMLLGFDMEVTRVMTVGVLGGLLGILMMIPLRRAFIVKQHGKLPYPEGTACADVLIVGEKGGATAATVFAGFGIAFMHKFFAKAMHLWKEEADVPLYTADGGGLRGGVLGGELSPELLGVGYIIGPRVASIMLAGGALAYLVLVPTLMYFSQQQQTPLEPAETGLIQSMTVGEIRNAYILYIGAGAVATGGIISMFQALPLIFSSIISGLRDLSKSKGSDAPVATTKRTDQDLPLWIVGAGSIGMVLALMVTPGMGLGLSLQGIVGAAMIVIFGFLFVTVSSRLTGEIGSSSNPISGMTVATLLLTCLVFVVLGKTDKAATLTALTVAAVVCIAASNGGTTAQDLKTGFLVGGTPKFQQIAIVVGSMTSALVMGVTLLLLNDAGTVYTNKPQYLPNYRVPPAELATLTRMERVKGVHAAEDQNEYHVLNVGEGEMEGVRQGKYLVNDAGEIKYLVDPAINGLVKENDDGTPVANKFEAPKTRLMALIIGGIFNQRLPWDLVLIGVVIALSLELAGVPSLPFAVGVYLPIHTSVPIFIGGVIRWAVDRFSGRSAGESESSPGVLLSSGYIAGGSLAGVTIAFMTFLPETITKGLDVTRWLPASWTASMLPAVIAFGVLAVVLFVAGFRRTKDEGTF